MRLSPAILAALATVPMLFGSSALANSVPNNPSNQLVKQVIDNEVRAQKADTTRWFYRSDTTQGNNRTLKEVIETNRGNLNLALDVNGAPVNGAQLKQEEQQLEQLARNPDEMQKRKQSDASDTEKARKLLQMLPEAFIYEPDGTDANGFVRLKFHPNPDFDPPTREAKVFHAMAGTLVVDPNQKRLVSISGTLTHDVNFGWGILGSLHKGGTFNVKRQEVAPGQWKEVLTDVHIAGRALFFHNISEQQHEVHSDFQRVSDNVTPVQAAEMLVQRASEQTGIKTASTPTKTQSASQSR